MTKLDPCKNEAVSVLSEVVSTSMGRVKFYLAPVHVDRPFDCTPEPDPMPKEPETDQLFVPIEIAVESDDSSCEV